ncbi:MAG TPA: hypothetical protein VI076_11045 [Actinopolymorphaceae bacterium]
MPDTAERVIQILRRHLGGVACSRTAAAISSVVSDQLDLLGHGGLFPKFVSYPDDQALTARLLEVLRLELASDEHFARSVIELVELADTHASV